METLVWTLGGILVLNVVVLGLAATLEEVERHRLFRQQRGLDELPGAPAGSSAGAAFGGAGAPRLHLVRAATSLPPRQGALRRASFVVALGSMIVATVVAFMAPVGRPGAAVEAAAPGSSAFAARTVDDPFARRGAQPTAVPAGIVRTGDSTDVAAPSVVVSNEELVPPVVAADSGSATTVRLVWAPVPDAIAYAVERWDDGTADALFGWELVATTNAAVTSYTDGGLESGTTYYYRVAAITDDGPAEPSAPVAVTTAPAPPVAPTIDVTVAGTTVTVAWSDLADETGYRIERSDDDGATWTVIGSSAPDVTSYEDTGLAFATTYLYRVVASNDGGESAASNVATATTEPEPAIGPDEDEGTDPGGAGSVDESADGALAEPTPAEESSPSPS